MMAKDYYFILGIPRTAGSRRVRSAFHALAKKLHPDHAGPQSADAFRELVEAYEVLSDPARRREYNSTLQLSRLHPEPLVPPTPAGRAVPARPFREPERVWPSFDALFDALPGSSADTGFPEAGHDEKVHVDVVLSPEEALGGCFLPLSVPVLRVCPTCGGAGRGWLMACPRCDMRGWLWQPENSGVRIPPGVRTGDVLDVSLARAGIRGFSLRLHVFVGT